MPLHILTGPPEDRRRDEETVRGFCGLSGRKIVCGGTTVGIVSAFLEREPVVCWETGEPGIPPWGTLEGLDMVTEGVHTLRALACRLGHSGLTCPPHPVKTLDRLTELLAEDGDIHFYCGRSGKTRPGEPDRTEILDSLVGVLRQLHRQVTVHPI